MSGSEGAKRPGSQTSFSDDSDSGKSAKKKTKNNDIKSTLNSDGFQKKWLQTEAMKIFFADIKSKQKYDQSIKKFKNNLNQDNFLKTTFPKSVKFNARIIKPKKLIFLRLDIQFLETDGKTKCAHLYNELSPKYSAFIDLNSIEFNVCETCTLKKNENDNIVIGSDIRIQPAEREHTDANEEGEMEVTKNINPSFAELRKQTNVTRSVDGKTVTVPASIYDSLLRISQQYEQLRREVDEIKKSHEQQASTSNKTHTQKVTNTQKNNDNNNDNNNDFPTLNDNGNKQSRNAFIMQFKKNKTIPPIGK